MKVSKSTHKGISYYISSSNHSAVGIDVETKRIVNKRLRRIYLNPKDVFLQEKDLLKEWVVKESCFKAINNFNIEIKLLSDFWVDFINKTFGIDDMLLGNFILRIEDGKYIAKSFIK